LPSSDDANKNNEVTNSKRKEERIKFLVLTFILFCLRMILKL